MAKTIAKEYIILDKNNCSGRISLYHVHDFCNSLSLGDQDLFLNEADDGMVMGENGVSIPLLKLKELSCGSSSGLENGGENREVDELSCESCFELEHGEETREEVDEFSFGSSSELENGKRKREEVYAEDELSERAESSRQRRIRECMKTLRNMCGGERMDSVQVIEHTIGSVKRLQMELLLKLQSTLHLKTMDEANMDHHHRRSLIPLGINII